MIQKPKRLLPLVAVSLLLVPAARAHCPLCTLGAGAAAGTAAMLGVGQGAIGVLVGGFAVSMGYWMSRLIKRQFVPWQRFCLIVISFLTTVPPLLAIMNDTHPVLVAITGGYGTVLNRTYLVNEFLLGSIMGGILVGVTPSLSRQLTRMRDGRMMPYQGTIMTVVLLIVTGSILQFLL